MSGNGRILKGEDLGPLPECSLPEYLLTHMRALPKDTVLQVDAETGATQTVHEHLSNSIRLSEGLRKLGLRPNDVVVMASRNSFSADEIVLATWLAGATIAPVNGSWKPVEMKHILNLYEPKFVFTEAKFAELVISVLESISSSATVILIDKGENVQSIRLCLEDVRVNVDVDTYRPAPVTSPSTQLVGILPSSGTTGLPKGVGLTHRSVIFQDISFSTMKFFSNALAFLQISSFFWVTGVLFYLRSLTSGMKRILIRDPTNESVLEAIDKYKAQWTMLAPAFLSAIANSPDFDKYDISSINYFVVGGSPFLRNIGEKLIEHFGREKILNCYGTTEAAGCILSTEYGNDVFSLGKPTPGVQVKIVDPETKETLGANSVGEICVKTPGRMWGYLKNEEETREAIDPDDWLHTGDLAYYDDSGEVYMVGRIKEMIKIMNMQISPLEVENSINALPGVLEAGVTGVSHDGNDIKLKALVVKEKNSPVTEEDIYTHVADTLSEFKRLTGGVDFVKSLPKSHNGKLLRKELNKLAQTLYTE